MEKLKDKGPIIVVIISNNYNKICGGYFSGKCTPGSHSDEKSFVFSVNH